MQFLHELISFKIDQKLTIFYVTFKGEFVAKNFQKSPNLVTLVKSASVWIHLPRWLEVEGEQCDHIWKNFVTLATF